MSLEVENNSFDNPFQLHQLVQTIERKLNSNPVDPKTKKVLEDSLDEINYTFQTLSELAKKQFADLEDKIIYLYGRINSLAADYELAQLKKKAEEIEKSFYQKTLSRKVDSLRKHLKKFCNQHRLLREEYCVIFLVRSCIKKADKILGNGTAQPEIIDLLEDDEERVYLYEIAQSFYEGNQAEALKVFYGELSASTQKKICIHLKTLQCENLLQDTFKTIQVLIALAEEREYPTRSEVEEIFQEARKCATYDIR